MGELESLAQKGLITLLYGDESHVCSEGYVPYGWQFPDEEVFIPVQKGYRLNCWGLISRQYEHELNQCYWSATTNNIDAQYILESLDMLSFNIHRDTFVVLDNASIHKAKIIQDRIPYWQKRGLYIFYLPTYSPQLNIAETMWRHLKGGWIKPEDYFDNDSLAYALNRCMSNIGINLKIDFKPFNEN